MIRQDDDRLHFAPLESSFAVRRRGWPRDDESPKLTGARVDALLGDGADERQPVDETRPSPIEGILLGVVAGIALWTFVAGAALLTWLG